LAGAISKAHVESGERVIIVTGDSERRKGIGAGAMGACACFIALAEGHACDYDAFIDALTCAVVARILNCRWIPIIAGSEIDGLDLRRTNTS